MTARVVQKFGGTSVADVARLQAVAQKVAQESQKGNQVAVVVSAMAGVTNQLADYTRQISGMTHTVNHDVVLSSGEQVTTGLLALALNQLGLRAEPFMGWQIPIMTDGHHTNATIQSVSPHRLEEAWQSGVIPVVAGFQGMTPEGRLTTLGRGGSDTTAVALAASLKADLCDIYTDVDGVYTADPRMVPHARKLDLITYDEMLELSACGAKVLHWRSVQTAKDFDVNLRVLSSFLEEGLGTRVVKTREINEDTCVSGLVMGRDEVKITLQKFHLFPDWQKALESWLKTHKIPADMMSYQNLDAHVAHVSWVMPESEISRLRILLEEPLAPFEALEVNHEVARVSVIGYGIASHLGIAGAVFQVLNHHGIMIQAVTTTPIKISVLVNVSEAPDAVRLLHAAYGLDAV